MRYGKLASVVVFVSLGCSGGGSGKTIVTTGHFGEGTLFGKPFYTVTHTAQPGPLFKKDAAPGFTYVTEGVVVDSGRTLEFLSLAEAKARFKDMEGVKALCNVRFDGQAHACQPGDCQGMCVPPKASPFYCACQ